MNSGPNFTINVKDLRKKNTKTLQNIYINCPVINLFNSIERKIKPIHKHEYNPHAIHKECIGNIINSTPQASISNTH